MNNDSYDEVIKLTEAESPRCDYLHAHDELVEAGGTYSKMWSDYLRSVEWKVAKEA